MSRRYYKKQKSLHLCIRVHYILNNKLLSCPQPKQKRRSLLIAAATRTRELRARGNKVNGGNNTNQTRRGGKKNTAAHKPGSANREDDEEDALDDEEATSLARGKERDEETEQPCIRRDGCTRGRDDGMCSLAEQEREPAMAMAPSE